MSKGKHHPSSIIATVILISLSLWFLNVPLVSYWIKAKEHRQQLKDFQWPDSAGTFGDSFGGLTCLFSGFSFCLLIYSFMRERDDAAAEKALLREQLLDGRVNSIIETWPFFVVTRHAPTYSDGLIMLNGGEDVYYVRWQATIDNKKIAEGALPSVNRGQLLYLKIPDCGSQPLMEIYIQYVTKIGEEEQNVHRIEANVKDGFFSVTDRKERVLKLHLKLRSEIFSV